ncbi:MAG TPA: cellulase family glycosylhydrolase [Pyrinomonadaceae bacterium]|nr:cellulase family glycosylhydrolase [Pyrinomonadaceae bacterium]
MKVSANYASTSRDFALLSHGLAVKRIGMLDRRIFSAIAGATIFILALISTAVGAGSADRQVGPIRFSKQSLVPASRLARLRRGINLSHWFAQSADYSKTHLESHTTAADFALIKSIGFDHVRLTLEPAPLLNGDDPGRLKEEYLTYLDHALDLILMQRLAVIVDSHPSDEFKLQLNTDARQLEAFGQFWEALARHLSTRDPERVFLEVLNEPMVEDGYRWFGIQGKLISAIRSGAPKHTIIASGHRWSGLPELLFMEPYADRNIVYNFHFYEPFPFTHQGATWTGTDVALFKNVPYPATPESVSKVLDQVDNEPARENLRHYGEAGWNAARIDREIGAAAAWAAKYRVPLTCNEFGTFRKFAPPVDRAAWIRDMRVALEKYHIGWTMWDYAGGFGVVNKQDGYATPDAEVVKALGLQK